MIAEVVVGSLKAVDSLFLANLLACLRAKSASWQFNIYIYIYIMIF